MNKIIEFFKRIFKRDKIKLIEAPKQIEQSNNQINGIKQGNIANIQYTNNMQNNIKEQIIVPTPMQNTAQNTRQSFIEDLREQAEQEEVKKIKIKTLICDGDGLGIQTKISY